MAATLSVLVACSDSDTIRSPDAPMLRLDTSSAVRIRSSESAVLYGVRDATELDDGTIVVANAGNSEVLLFRCDGSPLHSFGHRGGGPGEFSYVSRVFKRPGDSIVAWDGFMDRLSVFSSDGSLGRTVDVRQLGEFSSVIGFLGDDFVFLIPVRYTMPRDSVRVLVSSSTTPLVTLPHTRNTMVTIGTTGDAFSIPHPIVFSPEAVVAAGSSIIAAGVSDVPEIILWNSNGVVAHTIRLDLPARGVTSTEIERYVERRRTALLTMQRDAASRQRELSILEQVEFADRYPFFDELIVSDSADVWVRAYVAQEDTIATWYAFQADGHTKGRLVIPSDWSLLHVGFQHLIVKATDSLDVEYLTRLRMR